MSKQAKVHDSVHSKASEIADGSDITIKEAIRQMCRDGGYDV